MQQHVKFSIEGIRFDILNRQIEQAVKLYKEEQLELHKESYEKFIASKEKEWSDTHEAPYEGNMTDTYPYTDYVGAATLNKGVPKIIAEQIKDWVLKTFGSQKMPEHVLAHIFSYISNNIPIVFSDETGAPTLTSLIKEFGCDDWHKGLFRLLTQHGTRGDLVKNQTTQAMLPYCALVPLVLAPYKKYRDIAYSAWEAEGLNYVVDPSLYAAMTYPENIPWSKEELIETRNYALSVKSGAKEGTIRAADKTFMLYGSTLPGFTRLPKLLQVMLCQTWAAHPNNRNKYMILDCKDWDNIPPTLIDSEEIFSGTTKPSRIGFHEGVDIPWD